jgi:hypothetical protein
MNLRKFILALTLVLAAAGCGSHVVQVTLTNTSQQPISTIVVDYPGATFGVNVLEPGKSFPYKIKPLETGPLKIQFTDSLGVIHTYTGTVLHKGDDGAIDVKLTQQAALPEAHLVR